MTTKCFTKHLISLFVNLIENLTRFIYNTVRHSNKFKQKGALHIKESPRELGFF